MFYLRAMNKFNIMVYSCSAAYSTLNIINWTNIMKHLCLWPFMLSEDMKENILIISKTRFQQIMHQWNIACLVV